MQKVNIIHLSDIHYNNTENMNNLMNNLQADLLKMKQELDEFHLLLITGDCIDKGQVNLFSQFSQKLNKIIKECGIGKKKVAVSIGNHDVNLHSKLLELLKKESEQNNKSTKAEIINNLEKELTSIYQEYNEFNNQYIITHNGMDVKDIPIRDSQNNQIMRIRLIILNSSWCTTIHNQYGELIIGDSQLTKIKEKINSSRNKNFDYIIMCMHHPIDWFKYEEQIKINNLMREAGVNFLFHGHIHTSQIKSTNNIDGNINTFCTGISYKKTGETSSTKSGMRYSIYQIDKVTKTMNIYIRSTNEKGSFVPDGILYSNVRNGFFTIPLENPYNCLMPFKSVDDISKSSIVLTQKNVERILEKENLLFKFYCNMSDNIYSEYCFKKEEKFEKYKTQWLKTHNISSEDKIELEKCEFDFEKEQFGLFCYDMLINLNALFFHGNVRFLIRKYNPFTKSHDVFVADGVNSANINEIKNFQWKNGLIYQSFIKKAALLQSNNLKYYTKGNSNIWKDSLTIAISDVTIVVENELIPILTLNIAIDSNEKEECLEALALSSIYEKINAIFKLYNNKVNNIQHLIQREDYL